MDISENHKKQKHRTNTSVLALITNMS